MRYPVCIQCIQLYCLSDKTNILSVLCIVVLFDIYIVYVCIYILRMCACIYTYCVCVQCIHNIDNIVVLSHTQYVYAHIHNI